MGYWDEYRKHGVWGGSDIPKHSAEINQVKGALNAIGISIDQYMDKRAGTYGGIIEVAGNPEPTGIKFFCKDPAGLAYRIQQLKDHIKPDDRTTAGGLFNAARASGDSYRESGLGMRLHIEVGDITDCHLDSHQIVAGSAPNGMGTLYDFDSIADHFTFDLGPELPVLKWLYFPLGRHASIGPYFTMRMNRPDPQFHDPRGGPDGGLEFGAGVSVRGTFSKFGSK